MALRESVVTFVLIVALACGGAIGILVLFDPRAQAFWGGQFEAFGTTLRGLLDALPLPGR